MKAYAQICASERARAQAYRVWLHYDNHHRLHTALGGLTPSVRVHTVPGKYS